MQISIRNKQKRTKLTIFMHFVAKKEVSFKSGVFGYNHKILAITDTIRTVPLNPVCDQTQIIWVL